MKAKLKRLFFHPVFQLLSCVVLALFVVPTLISAKSTLAVICGFAIILLLFWWVVSTPIDINPTKKETQSK